MPQTPISGEMPDFSQLADPEFLAERRRVREALESAPEESAERGELAARYGAMNDEFDRRASASWRAAS